ncbi:MAG: peptidoglycan editing factor PgeF [Candidatus Aminicenantales bacterium]
MCSDVSRREFGMLHPPDYSTPALRFFVALDIKTGVMPEKRPRVLAFNEWMSVAFVVHGFGTRFWRWEDFKTHPNLRIFRPLALTQVHSNILHTIDEFPEQNLRGDALMTKIPGVLLVVKTADCLPVLAFSEKERVVAAVHCGWRSTSQRLIQTVVDAFQSHAHADPSSLRFGLGPSIASRCYPVGEDVLEAFRDAALSLDTFTPDTTEKGKYLLDLKRANRSQLLESGVLPANILSLELCPHCEEDMISARRDGRTRSRMLNFIGITAKE